MRSTGAICAIAVGLTAAVPCFGEWNTYQHDPGHTGYVAGRFNPANFQLRWSIDTGDGVLSTFAVGAGNVYFVKGAPFEAHLRAVDAGSGQLRWSHPVESTDPPAYANGIVYKQSVNHMGDTWLYGIDAATGSDLFKSPFGAQYFAYLAPTVFAGHVYMAGGQFGGMYSFDAVNGKQDWFAVVPQFDQWTPAVDERYAYAFTGSGIQTIQPGNLTIIDRVSGETRAVVIDPGFDFYNYSMESAVVLGALNNAIVTTGGRDGPGRVVCFDLENLSIRWATTGPYYGQPSLANGTVYVSYHGGVAALSEATGEQLWDWSMPDENLFYPVPLVVSDSLLFAGSLNNTYAIDLQTHETVWTYPLAGRFALSDGSLYISGLHGVIAAITLPEPCSVMVLLLGLGLCHRRPVRASISNGRSNNARFRQSRR
jgi:outer membrane protein assembly factor BamB